ncbi:hypothetical protein AMTRI_Chr06g178470 [Amborella trichopoda]
MLITLGFISSLKTAISRSSPNSLMAGVTGAQKEPNNPRPTCHPPYASWQQRKWMKKWEAINQNRPPTGTYNPRPGCCCLYCTRKPWFESWVLGLTQENKWVLIFTKSGITLTCDKGGKLSVLDEAYCSNLYITIPLCILGSMVTEDKFTAL